MILYLTLGFVALQRLGELVYARHNTARLLENGGIEVGAGHYPLLVMLHSSWLIALAVFVHPDTVANLALLLVFAALQLARVWVLVTLGRNWTTRIVTVPDAPLVRTGPYKFLRHPNYVIVASEIAVLPLVFGAWKIAAVFSLLNLVLLRHRIRIENSELAQRRSL